jgi:hypothetical protein
VVLRQLLAQAKPQGREDKGEAMNKDEALDLALEALELSSVTVDSFGVQSKTQAAITAIKQARSAPVQEPVTMRMPKVGDRVVCIEDESLGTIVYLTAGGSPEIKFDDGSHGTYMLREFAELFGYTTPPAAPEEPVYHLRQFGDVTKEQLDRYMATGDINPPPAPVQSAERGEPVAQGSKEHLKIMMEEIAWEGRLELSDALANIDEFYTTPPAAQRQCQPCNNDCDQGRNCPARGQA